MGQARVKIGCALLAAGLMTLGVAGVTHAVGGPVPITLFPSDAQGNRIPRPGYWVITATPGSSTQLFAVVGDPSHQATVARVIPVDATDALYGGIAYKLPDLPRKSVGAWVRLPTNRVHLDPQKGAILAFRVVVPKGTRPGQYVGGLSAYVPNSKAQSNGHVSVIVQPRVVTAVEVIVPGQTSSRFVIGKVGARRIAGNTYVVTHMRNTGTTLLKGAGYLWVYQHGRRKPVIFRTLNVDTSLPSTTVTYPVQWTRNPSRGIYRWVIELSWTGAATSASGSFTVK